MERGWKNFSPKGGRIKYVNPKDFFSKKVVQSLDDDPLKDYGVNNERLIKGLVYEIVFWMIVVWRTKDCSLKDNCWKYVRFPTFEQLSFRPQSLG